MPQMPIWQSEYHVSGKRTPDEERERGIRFASGHRPLSTGGSCYEFSFQPSNPSELRDMREGMRRCQRPHCGGDILDGTCLLCTREADA